jgi:acyl-CoA thioesterase YciA
MSEPYLAIQVVMMPRDVNPHGTIFGGVLLSYIDQAAAIGAIREVVKAGGLPPAVVTVAINKVEFKQPVLVGDVVRFMTRLVRMGRTSITVHVSVEAERAGAVLRVTEAELVYVGVDLSTPERTPKPGTHSQTLAAGVVGQSANRSQRAFHLLRSATIPRC